MSALRERKRVIGLKCMSHCQPPNAGDLAALLALCLCVQGCVCRGPACVRVVRICTLTRSSFH